MTAVLPAPTVPAFFDEAPAILVHDALAEFLGAAGGGGVTRTRGAGQARGAARGRWKKV